ncbi:hypothetical protein [Streptomyces sp. JJ36]|uniref:hypothetical protein n=1 Tax=Streptomyces sp. JJ36 TaxID=2736645 RepID=UPI001F1BB6FE|nr:hypothetical protein [Streptomyces sp. JJ36]MCF6526614.1 hypothetical protein [Streptomyces sp. JJ36]
MLVHQPWDAQVRGNDGLAGLREAVEGAAVRTVRYVVPQGENWPEGHREDRAHEVDMAVELGLDTQATLAFFWSMDGVNEGLAIAFRAPGEGDVTHHGDAIDVSGHVDWEEFLGQDIVGITPAWHIPNEGCPEMPWAYRLEFSRRSSLVIALGEAEGSGFTYMPDALVVIFDRSLSVSYEIPASGTSSYG